MKITVTSKWTQLALIMLFCNFYSLPSVLAQDNNNGLIDGTVHTADGGAASLWVEVNVFRDGKKVKGSQPQSDMDGFYEIRGLKPDVYEIRVTVQRSYDWAPQRIFGVVVDNGARTRLNIMLKEGKTLEEIGKPTINTKPALIITQELERLQQEINELKNN